MRKIVIALFLIIYGVLTFTVIVSSQGHPNKRIQNLKYNGEKKYISPTPGEIPIVATTVFMDEIMPDPEVFKAVEECGFNVVLQNSTKKIFESVFRMLDNTKLKLILSSGFIYDRSEKECREYIDKFKNEKSLGGWGFKDEPVFVDLEKYEQRYRLIEELDSSHLIYMNIVGEVSPIFMGPKINTIRSYLDLIWEKFTPMMWSYDFYPIKVSDKGKIEVDYDNFFSDLDAFSEISILTGRPFWAYCQSVGYRNKYFERPVPTEAYLRFEAFSALAYGAQGIVYWTYMQRPDVKSINFEYLEAPVDRKGNKTKVWYAARNVNKEIEKYKEVFLGCRLVRCIHTGVYYKGKNLGNIDEGFGPFSHIQSEKSGVLISELDTDGKRYIVFVNHDVKEKQKIGLKIKNGYSVKYVSGKNEELLSGIQKTFKLNPGGFLIFSVRVSGEN